jgi:hypothetical protein
VSTGGKGSFAGGIVGGSSSLGILPQDTSNKESSIAFIISPLFLSFEG